MRYPVFLKEQGTIGFVAPSFGCSIEPYRTAFDHSIEEWSKMGHGTVLGPNVYESSGIGISAAPEKCGRELTEGYVSTDSDVLISCGESVDIASLGTLPAHVQVQPRVDQLDVLARADVFLTHCGMNSISESMYMATPCVLYPQTGEQEAVARRVREIGAGIRLKDDSAEGIRAAVQEVLQNKIYAQAAQKCSAELRSCPGLPGAAAFIEQAPHTSEAPDPLAVLNKENGKAALLYWMIAVVIGILIAVCISPKFIWIVGMVFGILQRPVMDAVSKRNYRRILGQP